GGRQQIDFVDVQHAGIRAREQSGFEVTLALLEGTLQVERAENPVLGRTDPQLDEGGCSLGVRQGGLTARLAPGALRTPGGERSRIATKTAAVDDAERWQQRGETTRGSGLGGALFAAYQHTAESWIDRVEHQRQAHPILTYQRTEGISVLRAHRP